MRPGSVWIVILSLLWPAAGGVVLRAADTNGEASTTSGLSWKDLVAIKGLEINPKLITGTDGHDSTAGVEYKFHREIRPASVGPQTELSIALRSEGLIVIEADKAPNHLITHGLRFSAIDLLPSRWTTDAAALKEHQALRNRIDEEYFGPWQENAEQIDTLRKESSPENQAEIARLESANRRLVEKAGAELEDYGQLKPIAATRQWMIQSGKGLRDWVSSTMEQDIRERFVFLNADVDGNVEHDQTFSNVQWVASGQLRGKLLIPFLDLPFKALRLGEDVKDFANRNGGPYFWGGAGVVDARNNDARMALTTRHDVFPRAHFGVFYRTEILSFVTPVAVELSWRYYHEIDAPAAIRTAHLEDTSYFKATMLFRGNYFLEYTHGKLPLDLETSSTVSAGWRYNF